ncbi:MAG: twin-arginine translocase subunit TatB [Proteobacteria bacterium]|uniref:Sec-independent protein translocase protein TatB n=1 Tax=Rudaea sp. TaxID=2136325 RepID=UPI001D44F6CD|nr:twin-arginine translocase subunit TatB [Pseudomonadota bacterium]MBS0568500.1 twin-arginine translocase subunit TatB [Pseudomonadota bacterium]
MFDFSFGEMGLIAVVALLVLGPERLPRVARTAGALARRARNSWQSVRDEIERELQAEDLKRSIEDAKNAAADLQNDIRGASAEVRSSIEQTAADVEAAGTASSVPAQPPNSAQDAIGHEQR